MKKFVSTLAVFVLLLGIVSGQEKQSFTPNGKAFAKVFWNFHYDMTPDVNQTSAFQIQRSYFGYTYSFTENISTKITFDVGKDDGSAYTAYLKTAQLDWKISSPIKLSLGLIGLKQFNDQESFWGYRYIYKSFQDQHGFGSSADLGVNAEIKLNPKLKMNVLLVNGEGYKKVQDNYGSYRLGANIVAQPTQKLTLKAYFDRMPGKTDGNNGMIKDTATISNLSFFAGYKTSKFRLGAEYNMLKNGTKYSNAAEDHDLSGVSIYSTYTFNKQWEVFARFDKLESNTLAGATKAWNASKDGSAFLTGVQYAVAKGIKMALNYRTWNYSDTSKDNLSLLFLNFEYKF